MNTNYMKLITERIEEGEKGSIFCAADFIDITSTETANRCLSRLNDKGLIRRIGRGLFEKPRFSKLLNKYVVPNVDNLIFAIARNNGWNIAPYEDISMNLLGISTQVPNDIIYVSSGPYKEYEFDMLPNTKIVFKHTATKDISNMSLMSATFVQAIKGKGKDRIYPKTIKILASRLNDKNKKILLNETKHTTKWVYEVIKKICM